VLTTYGAPLLVLGVLVLVHEFGHFWVAKRSGVRVLKFSIGMGPRLVGVRRGDTEYLVSWIPFGGYVKMAGEDPDEGGSGAPDEFASKRPAVRAAIIAAGPAMNYVLAIVLYTALFALHGVETITTRTVGRVESGSVAEEVGFLAGDEVVSVGGAPVRDWRAFLEAVSKTKSNRVAVGVRRSGAESEIALDAARVRGGAPLGLVPFVTTEIGEVQKGGPAWAAGLRRGDRILSIAGEPVAQWSEVAQRVHRSAGVPLEIAWDRGGRAMTATITPEKRELPVSETETETVGLIRIGQRWDRERIAPWSALALGAERTWWVTREVFAFIGSLFRGRVSLEMVGGPIRIGQIAGESARWGVHSLVGLVALLSVNLAVLNLLPIPILDGGHLFMLLVEKVIGRALSIRQRIVLQQIGLVVIILLMVTVTAVDFRRLFR
jgi:regulator of sigma E protease